MAEPITERGLLALPTELIHAILLALPPLCIEHFSQTCKRARHHVYGDDSSGDLHLWKQMYLQRFDDFEPLWAGPSVMPLVQLRDRAARLYGGDPTNHAPISLNFNAVLSALLSVIDTAVPPQDSKLCRNTTWLDDSVLSSGQATWSEWVFPRTIMHSLDEFNLEKAEANSLASAPKSPQKRKRRRLAGSSRSAERQNGTSSGRKDSRDEATTSTPGATSQNEASTSRRRSSSSTRSDRPDSTRRRSARLLKLMYPESLHGLVDEGIDIDAIAPPSMRLAARIHCLHGIRAWKDSQKQRLTASPQEIPGQRQQQDGLANQGAAQASAQASAAPSAQEEGNNAESAVADGVADQSNNDDAHEDHDNEDGHDEEEDDDDESFDEPPEAILRFRPRMFGPSFGFCRAPDEEDEVRARMRHRVYDSGYYGWSNGYGPLHAWRHDPKQRDRNDDDDAASDGDDADPDDSMAYAGGDGSQDGDDDALREALELSDDDIPDDPIPIEIEVSDDEDRRTFQVADRYGNPIDTVEPTPSTARITEGWDSSDDEADPSAAAHAEAAPQNSTGRSLYQAPDLGTYDANTATYTYEGHQPIGIVTSSRDIQVTVGNTIDFIASGELNIRFIRPGMLAETMRVTSGSSAEVDDDDEDDDADEDADDDYDEDADDWNEHDGMNSDDDDDFGPFFGMFRPLAGAEGYRGSRADQEIQHLIEPRSDEDEKAEQPRSLSLRRKSIHWELVEAIMVVMYANLKEAIWLENWGVGIRIPKVYDEAGILVRDPMEMREFLDFPTGWMSTLPSPLPSKLHIEDAVDEASAKDANAPTNSEVRESSKDDDEDAKPHDWAHCESFWAGTYAFLDYSHFVDFNVRLARRRREALARAEAYGDGKQEGKSNGSDNKSSGSNGTAHEKGNNAYLTSTPKPSLLGQEEAVGDCLQLRLELLPKSQQPAYNADEEGQEDDEDYPTLYFRGTTVTYWGNEAPMPRGGVHGKVRPVYAREQDVDAVLSNGPRGNKKIEGLHWSLTHVYEGEDRWQLEGIQPGPPGTRAPIFGIWTDAIHEEESPNGPFVYWMMDERPWKEIDRINRQDAHNTAAARAAGNA